ncbi:MAG: hypothetical protein WBQ14_11440 [Gaiellaceae bacterium]
MAAKQRADIQKEKEKKEKIILAVLVGLLVIVGALELPKMLKKSSPPAVAATQTTSTSPGAIPSGTAASGPIAVETLPNQSSYQAGNGQLSQFSLFKGQDPFGSANKVESASAGSSEMTTNATKTTSKSYSAANISVNGVSQAVLVGGTFPSSSPAFVLASFTPTQIKVGVNGGSFSGGQAKVTINKGRSVVLVNTVDSVRYVIKYVAPLTADEASSMTSPTTSISTTTATTTSATTTAATTSTTP